MSSRHGSGQDLGFIGENVYRFFDRLPLWAAYLTGCFADLLGYVTGRPGILSRDKILDARQRYWICDPTRAAAELGFDAKTSLREGVAATLEWYRNERWLTY